MDPMDLWIDARCQLNLTMRTLNKEKLKAYHEFTIQQQLCFTADSEKESRIAARKAVHRANRAYMCQHKAIQLQELQEELQRNSMCDQMSKEATKLCAELCDAARVLDFDEMKGILEELQEHFKQLELFDDRKRLDSDQLMENFEVEQMVDKARQSRMAHEVQMQAMPEVLAPPAKNASNESDKALTDLQARLQALLRF